MTKARAILMLTLTILFVSCSTVRYSEKVVYISPKLVTKAKSALTAQFSPAPLCETDCLEVRDEPNATPTLRYRDSITNFSFTAGFTYRLKIQVRTEDVDTLSGGTHPSETWTLLETLEKTPAQ